MAPPAGGLPGRYGDAAETPRRRGVHLLFSLPQIAAFPGATVQPGATPRSQEESGFGRVVLTGLEESPPPQQADVTDDFPGENL